MKRVAVSVAKELLQGNALLLPLPSIPDLANHLNDTEKLVTSTFILLYNTTWPTVVQPRCLS